MWAQNCLPNSLHNRERERRSIFLCFLPGCRTPLMRGGGLSTHDLIWQKKGRPRDKELQREKTWWEIEKREWVERKWGESNGGMTCWQQRKIDDKTAGKENCRRNEIQRGVIQREKAPRWRLMEVNRPWLPTNHYFAIMLPVSPSSKCLRPFGPASSQLSQHFGSFGAEGLSVNNTVDEKRQEKKTSLKQKLQYKVFNLRMSGTITTL